MTDTPEKRKPGRPKGQPRTGGRKAGVPNKLTKIERQYIAKHADPVGFGVQVLTQPTVKIGRGKNAVEFEPTPEMRIQVFSKFVDKVVPTIKPIEVSGPDGSDQLIVRITRHGS